MAEVVIARRVLVLRAERNGRDDLADARRLHRHRLLDGIVVDRDEVLSKDLATLDADASLQLLGRADGVEPVLTDELRHAGAHLVVTLPLLFQALDDRLL